jgi:hypothetical protein
MTVDMKLVPNYISVVMNQESHFSEATVGDFIMVHERTL